MKRDNQEHFIYGLNNTVSLLSSEKYIINSIVIMRDSIALSNSIISSYIKDNQSILTILNKRDFLSKYDYKHTQGIIVFFSGELLKDFNKIEFSNKNICYIIIDQINDPQNLGQIIRTCECAGIDGIILPKHGSVHITNSVLQVSQGAFNNVDLFMVTNINDTIKRLKDDGFWITGVENSINSKKWYEIDYCDRIGIVFGSEGKGIRRLVKESCDFLATIPMKGSTNSLNVSATISAILFERQRQIDSK
mgnify:CR=1 FL=1